MILTKENNISEEFAFEGIVNILILGGIGSLMLERNLGDSDFYPITGYEAFPLNGGCAYNGSLENRGLGVTFRWVATLESGEVEIAQSRCTR